MLEQSGRRALARLAMMVLIVAAVGALLVYVIAPFGNRLSDSDRNALFLVAMAFGLGWMFGMNHERAQAEARQKREERERNRQEQLGHWSADAERLTREKWQEDLQRREEHLNRRR